MGPRKQAGSQGQGTEGGDTTGRDRGDRESGSGCLRQGKGERGKAVNTGKGVWRRGDWGLEAEDVGFLGVGSRECRRDMGLLLLYAAECPAL